MAATKAMTPIVAGAQYRDVSTGDSHGDLLRVKSVWVDEDAQVQVQVFEKDQNLTFENRPHTTVDLESFIDRIDSEIIRVNSDHDAWEWRQ